MSDAVAVHVDPFGREGGSYLNTRSALNMRQKVDLPREVSTLTCQIFMCQEFGLHGSAPAFTH